MKHQRRTLYAVPWVILVLLAATPAAWAQTSVDITYTWTPPTTGSAVHHYVVEVSVAGSPYYQVDTVTSNTYTFTAPIGETHQVRVAGVDAQDRQGPYSQPSDPYIPDVGPPGQPGKPQPIF
jgi:hypothetical protein